MLDPLHKWLGIPPSEQPPNEYRLLGITNFESDSEVIDGAADKHLAFLHGLANGEHSGQAEELSNRISAARLRLLKPKKKAAYDQQLRQCLEAMPPSQGPGATLAPPGTPPLGSAPTQPSTAGITPVVQASIPEAPTWQAPVAAGFQQPISQQPARSSTRHVAQVSNAVSIGMRNTTKRGPTKRKLAKRRSPSSSLFPSWKFTVLPGVIALALLLGLVMTGRMRLDRNRMVAIGVPEALVAILAGVESPEETYGNSSANSQKQGVTRGNAASPRTNPSNKDKRSSTVATNTPGSRSGSPSNQPPSTTTTLGFSPPAPRSGSMAQEPAKSTLPTPSEIEIKLKVVRSIYKQEYEAAKTKEQKLTLANKLLDDVDEMQDDAAGQYVLMRTVRNIYMDIDEYDFAMDTVDQMTEYFNDIDAVKLKSESLALLRSVATGKTFQYIDAVLEVAHESFLCGQLLVGQALIDHAADKLPSGIPNSREEEFTKLSLDFQNAIERKQAYETGLISLQSDPRDAEAATAVGRYLCFVGNRWEDGIGYLAEGTNSSFSAAAKVETSRLLGENNELEVAETWYDAASQDVGPLEKRRIYDHAFDWYQKARKSEKGLEAIQIDEILKKIEPLTTSERVASFQTTGEPEQPSFLSRQPNQPRVMNEKTWNSMDYTDDFATIDPGPVSSPGYVISLAMRRKGQVGETVAGLELKYATKIRVVGRAQQGIASATSLTRIGFFVDYHTPKGYSKRVFLEAIGSAAIEHTGKPDWGRGTKPDQVEQINRKKQYDFDLKKWAPPDWDRRCWFSVYMKDGGRERALRAVVSWAP